VAAAVEAVFYLDHSLSQLQLLFLLLLVLVHHQACKEVEILF
jgi:hypothetical protein